MLKERRLETFSFTGTALPMGYFGLRFKER